MSTSIQVPEKFTGYGARTEADGKAFALEPIEYTPKKWSEDDVDLKILACGICGSGASDHECWLP